MDRLKKIIFVFSVLISPILWAQKTTPSSQKNISATTDETVYVNINATSFVTGETIFYKLFCLNPSGFVESYISKLAYVELIGNDKKIVFTHKLFLENGIGQGDFFIPPSIPTGTYKLIGYTKWMLNRQNFKSFETDITIINPFQNDENKISSKNKILPASEINNKDIELNKKVFTSRELVDLKIKNLSSGNYTVSVRKVQDLPSIKNMNSILFSKTETNQTITDFSNLILPELRGEIISGIITSKNNEFPVNNISVSLSIPGKVFEFKLVKTNEKGGFIFNLDKPYYEPDLIIQVVNGNKEEYAIIMDKPTMFDMTNVVIENDSKLSSDLKSIIEEHAVASQIENTYFEKKADTLLKAKDQTLFYEPNAKEYIFDNYTRFPTIKESITEVIKEMHYYKKDKNYTLYLSDYDPNTEVEESPLVLMDGFLVQDINELLEFKAINIYKVCIISGGYLYGNKKFNGLISFISKKYDFSTHLSGDYILKNTISTPLAKKNYFKPDYSNKTNLDRIPDYRYQLLWLTDLNISNNKSQISFYTSDKTGIFEISIEGFTKQGNPISMKSYFEVK